MDCSGVGDAPIHATGNKQPARAGSCTAAAHSPSTVLTDSLHTEACVAGRNLILSTTSAYFLEIRCFYFAGPNSRKVP
jgi:hypothetical protein